MFIVFERGEEQDSEIREEEDEEPFEEDADLYNNVLKKLLPGEEDSNPLFSLTLSGAS